MGNQHPSIAPYETLLCRDGRLAVACGNDAQFRRLAATLGQPALADDLGFATNSARVEHRPELVEALEAALCDGDAATWATALAEAGVPAGQVGDIASAFALAESLGLQPTVDVGPSHSRQVRHPITYSRSVPRTPEPPPALGVHNDDVRGWLAKPATRHTRGEQP